MLTKGLATSVMRSLKTRYRRARKILPNLVSILVSKYQAKKIVLIGSLARKKDFGFHSDIDLCTLGVEKSRYFQALGELLISAEEFDVDLICIEDADARLLAQVAQGEVLYDQG